MLEICFLLNCFGDGNKLMILLIFNDYAHEGTYFSKYLFAIGIVLLDREDLLIWSINEKEGTPSTKLAYISILEDNVVVVAR